MYDDQGCWIRKAAKTGASTYKYDSGIILLDALVLEVLSYFRYEYEY